MNRNRFLLVLALLIIVGGTISIKAYTAQIAQGGRQWEYCEIKSGGYVPGSRSPVYAVHIYYFRDKGIEIEKIEGQSTTVTVDQDEAKAKAFAMLGAEGWELAGISRMERPTLSGLSHRGSPEKQKPLKNAPLSLSGFTLTTTEKAKAI